MKKTVGPSDQKGYVALLSVLIMGAVSLSVGLALLLQGADSQRQTLVLQQSMQARGLAQACAEEALQQMYTSNSFTGTNTMNLGQGSCTYAVTSTGGSNRTIDTSGIVNDVVRRIKIHATITTSIISVISWQEVSDA